MSLTAGMYPNRQQEELEKNAEMELFVKIAAQQGIDLAKMNDDEVSALYNYTFDKTAEESPFPPKKDEDDKGEKSDKDEDEKKEAASREHQTKLAFAREMEQADKLGRHMAHCYIDELNKVGSALISQQGQPDPETTETKEAAMPAQLASALGKVKSVAGKVGDKIKNAPEIVGGTARRLAGDMPAGKALRSAPGQAERTKNIGKGVLAGGAALAAGGAGAAALHGRKKEGSAIDQLALEQAVKIAFDANFDPEEAADKVAGVFLLGLEDSTKVATTLDQQVNIRALEFLEAAGYPVTWAS